jgi:uncharacterized protein involved in tellurium resistance
MEKTKSSAKQFIYDLSGQISLLTDAYLARFSSRKAKENQEGNWRQSIVTEKPKWEYISWLVIHPANNQVEIRIILGLWDETKYDEKQWIQLKSQLESISSKKSILYQPFGDLKKQKFVELGISFTVDLLNEELDQKRLSEIMPVIKTVLNLFVNFASQHGIAGIKAKKTREVLTEKNQEVKSKLADSFKVRLRWFKDIDFDLAALYTLKNGEKGLVYFGNKGSLTSNPYINLDKDAMYGGEDEKVETLSVINKNHIDKVFIICWDWSNLGGSSAFDRSNVNVAISDNNDNLVIVKPTTASGNDSVCIAEISFNDDGVAVKNKSVSFKRPGPSAIDIYNIIK